MNWVMSQNENSIQRKRKSKRVDILTDAIIIYRRNFLLWEWERKWEDREERKAMRERERERERDE